MDVKRHLQAVLLIVSLLLLTAVYIYASSCQPTFVIGLCSALRLTRVSFFVMTALNFLVLATLAYKLKIKNTKKIDIYHLISIYFLLLIVSFGMALLEINFLTYLRFSNL